MGEAVRSTAWPRFALLYAALDATFESESPSTMVLSARGRMEGGGRR